VERLANECEGQGGGTVLAALGQVVSLAFRQIGDSEARGEELEGWIRALRRSVEGG